MEPPDSKLDSSPNGNGVLHDPTADDNRTSKVAACLNCRRSKVKCERGGDTDRCRRCLQTGSDCVRPTFNVGRRKGVKNKRKGLEKALYQVEEALKKASGGAQNVDAGKAILELKTLLQASQDGRLQGIGAANGSKRARIASSNGDLQDSSSDEDDDEEQHHQLVHRRSSQPRRESTASNLHAAVEERLAVDDAENPLQLLARASNLHLSPKSSSHDQSPRVAVSLHPPSTFDEQDEEYADVQTFFAFSSSNLDVGKDYDPVDLGLVSEEEAETLFTFFHQNLAHTRWGLDPVLYTVPFTRARSCFLFTSIMAASALFMPNAAALSKRLSNHCKELALRCVARRHRSVEVVLAFMINVPWMVPGEHSTDDDTCWYVSMAATIAIDVQLHKIHMPLEAFRDGSSGNLSRADCIDPKGALILGGFPDVDPLSELGKRLIRRRERCWIALFVLERGMCLARGRSYTVPITPLVSNCDRWHISDVADGMDGHLVSMAVLRRDLDGLFATIRSLCDGSREGLTDGSLIAQSIQSTVEKFFEQWHLEWGMSIGSGPHNRLPPYVEILVTHTRLSIYSSVINHPTAPTEVRQFFRTAGLSSSLNVMRAAIQGESQLISMPNNTAIMISFAACFALRLSAQVSGNSNLAPSVRTLIEETADVLERIGHATQHRNGMPALYGKYLRFLVRKAASASDPDHVSASIHQRPTIAELRQELAETSPFHPSAHSISQVGFGVSDPMVSQGGFMESGPWAAESLQFSSMSDDQIVEALNRAGNEFDTGFGQLGWEDPTSLEWMNWSNLPEFGF